MLREESAGSFAVMSDWFSLTGSPETALKAGLDLEMPFPLIRGQNLVAALEAEAASPSTKPGKSLKEYAVESVDRLLELRRRCLSGPVAAEESERDTPELRETLYQGAIGSAVLLKNNAQTLPLSQSALRHVAVVGSLAVEPTYSGQLILLESSDFTELSLISWLPIPGHSAFINPLPNSKPLEAIRAAVESSASVSFHRGLEISRVFPILSSDSAGVSLASPIRLEYFNSDKSALPPLELDLALFDVFEKPIPGLSPEWSYRLTMEITPDSELPLFISFASPSPCTITVGEGAEQALEYIPPYVTTEEFIFHRYKYNQVFSLGSRQAGVPLRIVVEGSSTPMRRGEPTPNGLQVGFEVGDRTDSSTFISEAVDSVKDAEVVIVFAGQHEQWESEGFDRADITLPGKQDDLILALADRPAHQKLVVVNQSSSPVDVSRWIDRVDAFLQMGIAGLEVGRGELE
jgi:beta-glucosidase